MNNHHLQVLRDELIRPTGFCFLWRCQRCSWTRSCVWKLFLPHEKLEGKQDFPQESDAVPLVLCHRCSAHWGAASLVTRGSAGHLNLSLAWKQLLKKNIYIFARERRKLRQLIHAPRLFQVFHFNQAAILPDFCFEHTLDSFCYLWKA